LSNRRLPAGAAPPATEVTWVPAPLLPTPRCRFQLRLPSASLRPIRPAVAEAAVRAVASPSSRWFRPAVSDGPFRSGLVARRAAEATRPVPTLFTGVAPAALSDHPILVSRHRRSVPPGADPFVVRRAPDRSAFRRSVRSRLPAWPRAALTPLAAVPPKCLGDSLGPAGVVLPAPRTRCNL
jgi:hypothetical protein